MLNSALNSKLLLIIVTYYNYITLIFLFFSLKSISDSPVLKKQAISTGATSVKIKIVCSCSKSKNKVKTTSINTLVVFYS